MKARFEFNLNDPEDDRLFSIHANSEEMAFFIWDLRHNILRNSLKDELSSSDICLLIQEKINELVFNIDDLVR